MMMIGSIFRLMAILSDIAKKKKNLETQRKMVQNREDCITPVEKDT